MITLWHNPRCSKSRQALALLEEAGAEITVRRYLEDAPNRTEIEAVRAAMGTPPVIDMMRAGEKIIKELGLTKTSDEDALIAAMAAHPILIERPVAICGDRAVIGRPPERVRDLL
ncbi:arsenate reductase (glutaredoxin) [Sulfitobacter sp. JBTF-M27]|uniref:Arsenate reductase n=1 Tax=Sulfitobacter sediminilitoris TaxID=2698830 RepID=A0A6P0CAP2_9RHOB|nr:arsenate reductase (glutaredoxin) [Sulfitobacter sediminilitoris]NEK22420.1 arsenate reductase (glutaredoxin) [Sulfitobacter sediminilitoris]